MMLVHLPSVDNRGHQNGWASKQQMKAIADADAAIGQLVQALAGHRAGGRDPADRQLRPRSAGKNHGPDDPRSRHIPWIAVGPGVRHGVDLTTYPKLTVNTEDTFATACWALGIPPTVPDMDGVPVKVILEPKDQGLGTELLHLAPALAPPGW